MSLSISYPVPSCAADGSGGIATFTLTITKTNFSGYTYGDFSLQTLNGDYVQGRRNYLIQGGGGTATQSQNFVGLADGTYLITLREFDDRGQVIGTTTQGFPIGCPAVALTGDILDHSGATGSGSSDGGIIKVQAGGGYPPLQAVVVGAATVPALPLTDGQPASFTNVPGQAADYIVRFTDSKKPSPQIVEKSVNIKPYTAPPASNPCESFALVKLTPVSPTLGNADGKILVSTTGGGSSTVIIRLFQDDGTGKLVQFDRTAQYTASALGGSYDQLPAGVYTVTLSLDAHPASCTISQLNGQRLDVDILPPDLEIGDQLTFLPWMQPLLLQAATSIGQRPTLDIKAGLTTDKGTRQAQTEDVAKFTGQIYGPGDVLGLAQRALLATMPTPNTTGFSPLQLAFIDFQDEDLPWRYSTLSSAEHPATSKTPLLDAAPLPWCMLLVLRVDATTPEFVAQPQNGQPLPSILVKAGARAAYPSPDPDQQKLWAHVQVNAQLGTVDPLDSTKRLQPTPTQIDTFVNVDLPAHPDLAYSRVLSARRLAPETTYQAFLVPAIEAGRLAGLGLDYADGDVQKSAIPQAADPDLDRLFPVYYHWQFATGAEEDFEALVEQLHPANDVTSVAVAPRLALAAGRHHYDLPLVGALADASVPPPTPSVDERAALLGAAQYLYQQVMAPARSAHNRPLVAAPLYGRAYMVRPTLLAPTTAIAPSWKHTLNLDPRYRALAALGAQVVRDNQEEYVRRAWEQAQDILLANEKLRGAQYGLRTTAGLRDQHLPLTTTTTTTTTTGAGTGSGTNATAGTASGQFAAVRAVRRTAAADPATTDAADASATTDADADATTAEATDQAAPTSADTGTAAAAATTTTTTTGMADYGLHLTGLAMSRVRISAATVAAAQQANPDAPTLPRVTVREAIRRSTTPLAAFSPTFRRVLKPFGNYQVGAAGRPLRPTQPAPAAAPTSLLATGTSLAQRDTLLSRVVAGQLTAAEAPSEKLRAYQFDDQLVDVFLKRPNVELPLPSSVPAAAQDNFQAAYAAFRRPPERLQVHPGQVVGFRAPQFVRPQLSLDPLKGDLVSGTAPGPVFTTKIKAATPVASTPALGLLSGGDYVGKHYNASHFYVGDYDEPSHFVGGDWLATDFNHSDFLVGREVFDYETEDTPRQPVALSRLAVRRTASEEPAADSSASASPTASADADANASADATASATATTASADGAGSGAGSGTVSSTTATAAAPPTDGSLPIIKQAKVVPVFKEAMGEQLRQRLPALFVPGLGDFPSGGLAVLDANQAFVEAYMVGLNHALGSELHWRGFPVDLRGTFFQQFWDVSEHFNATLAATDSPTAAQEAAMLDITPLDTWVSKDLGDNAVNPVKPGQETLRLALRSELLRRYPNLIVALQDDRVAHATEPENMHHPLQRLAVGQDLLVVTFDVSLVDAQAHCALVLMERPGQPKFGFDAVPADPDHPLADPLSWNDLTWTYAGTSPGHQFVPATSAQPGSKPHASAEPASVAYLTDSATVAYALFQEPILATIPVNKLISL